MEVESDLFSLLRSVKAQVKLSPFKTILSKQFPVAVYKTTSRRAGPQKRSLSSTLFHYNINEIPKELNSC